MSEKFGYRGYIGSRPVRGTSYPHRVQNLVIRDYANRRKLPYKLSATEYAMSGCYMMLADVVTELPSLDGIILFSLFMLPQRPQRRREIYDRVLTEKCQLHAALEAMVLADKNDIEHFEETIEVAFTLPHAPMRSYYPKTGKIDEKDSFWKALNQTID
ncbi:sporadic carbohydrate cluster protein, TIGR04323 family [Lusitaniella coriacea LEGE 07157]|uniref:Sporadic carbohydrate cluster protein, TIGR04323 family n=1 Tax=Lusitaniella coriacea LEGE 07157 TaxID=945747 RepID=A0A8J7J3C1_9CYAN|nr:LIC12192 family sporadic carbohydrate cluster protein [Lusitaniella coriacea]MBE9116884.1 sporadic carbohydrate cluster protein, TIGR04323 family [Lusitaniella coriacea LEGE 07157]